MKNYNEVHHVEISPAFTHDAEEPVYCVSQRGADGEEICCTSIHRDKMEAWKAGRALASRLCVELFSS